MEGKGDIKSLWKVQEREVNKCIGVKGDWGLSKGLQPLDDDSVWYISKHSGEDWTVGRDVYVGCHSMCNFDKNKAFLSFPFFPCVFVERGKLRVDQFSWILGFFSNYSLTAVAFSYIVSAVVLNKVCFVRDSVRVSSVCILQSPVSTTIFISWLIT